MNKKSGYFWDRGREEVQCFEFVVNERRFLLKDGMKRVIVITNWLDDSRLAILEFMC